MSGDRIQVTLGAWRAIDYGGPYIEVFYGRGGDALDVINVWDYDANARRELFDRATVRRELREWASENGQLFYDNVIAYL